MERNNNEEGASTGKYNGKRKARCGLPSQKRDLKAQANPHFNISTMFISGIMCWGPEY